MRYSVNECRYIARLAARGAGLSWGLAEEAGHAAAWLAMRGLHFSAPFISCARQTLHSPNDNMILQGELESDIRSEMLNPFLSGIAICDLSRARPLRWRIRNVAHPIILAPFVAFAAMSANEVVKIEWQEAEIITDGKHAALIKDTGIDAVRADASIAPCSPPCDFHKTALAESEQCKVAAKDWRQLNSLAARTYVPASEESRRRAGAGKES